VGELLAVHLNWGARNISSASGATALPGYSAVTSNPRQAILALRVRDKTDEEQGDVMSKRSASNFLKVLTVLVMPLALVGLTAASGNAATASSPTFFGAKLSSHTEPSNAENGQRCDENAGIPHGATCTWVAISAFENGSHFTAPKTGTVKHVKLVSCKAGKFRLQLAQANPSARKAKIVVNGPEITYQGQSPCGGSGGQHFIVQTFKVNFKVAKGDFIAIKARSTGTLSCSGGDGFLLYGPPLPVGGPFKKSHAGASCDLLVQLSYK
jgi:hypothetical protein